MDLIFETSPFLQTLLATETGWFPEFEGLKLNQKKKKKKKKKKKISLLQNHGPENSR